MQQKLFLLTLLLSAFILNATAENATITIHTKDNSLVYKVDDKNKVRQSYYGKRINDRDIAGVPMGKNDAYPAFGTSYINEPALRAVHHNGNTSTELFYDRYETKQLDDNTIQTDIYLKDNIFPFQVKLCFKAYQRENVIEQWAEISHKEKKDVTLYNFASSFLSFNASQYWLTQFLGNWAEEMRMAETPLVRGIKTIETKLGVRTNQYEHACFFVGLEKPSQEESGNVIGGTLAYPGSWQLAFNVDELEQLHIISGMNPFASQYTLKPGENFKTPALLFSYSENGKGDITRNFHRWARKYGIHNSAKPHMTLLNNWEATYFDFNEEVLTGIIGDTKDMGLELFLLDDGWFGNKYPRSADNAALGDWDVNRKKLPNGIGHLVNEAKKQSVKFGIWVEPEMVNPKSELYEKHPDWVITQPGRPLDLSRNQLVLDLSNPKVQDHVFSVIDNVMGENPEIAYIKWDCNRFMTNAASPYLPAEKQSHLWIEYTRGLYKVLEKVRAKYPDVTIMCCSGGGGRIDYGTLPYFDEYWISDNTDALDRIFIQWGAGQFFLPAGLASHVSVVPNHITQRSTPLKFRFDVAMAAKLGMDLQPRQMSDKEKAFSKNAIKEYNKVRGIVQNGDLYRLLSPYENKRTSMMYVTEDRERAVVYSYLLKKAINPNMQVLYMKGLDPDKTYTLNEVNKDPERYSWFTEHEGKKYSGDFLMTHGVIFPMYNEFESVVFELKAE